MHAIRRIIQKILPSFVFDTLISAYHFILTFVGAVLYGFPSRKIVIIGVTGTKGKTSVAEIVNSIFEVAGHKTALAGTIRFKIDQNSRPNLYKMTMPGRLFLQKFLREAIRSGCTHVILEMTSEGAKQFRHKFIELDALIFTNLAPEHIESHGSYEKYRDAKLSLARGVGRGHKIHTAIIANRDDREGKKFFDVSGTFNHISYSLSDASPYNVSEEGIRLEFQGEKISSALKGEYNVYNILAACYAARFFNISREAIKQGVERVTSIRGRLEKISDDPNWNIYVDYAHTPDSLKAVYGALSNKKLICVFGSTGGGRDRWKRKTMGEIADKHCTKIILTNEDPYDENPERIIADIRQGIRTTPTEVVMERREAIRQALNIGRGRENAIIISGKGTDPYIMLPNGKKLAWDDAQVTREELQSLQIEQST